MLSIEWFLTMTYEGLHSIHSRVIMLLFDIGANIGRWSLANEVGNRIITIEASPTTFHRLKENTKGFPNIECLWYAVSPSTDDDVEFFESNADTLSTLDPTWLTDSSSRFYGQYTINHSIRVPTISIDSLVQLYGTPDILKLDVEGAEHIVLRSLTKKLNTVCFEWASEWKAQARECIDHLVSLGYSKFYLQFGDEYTFRPDDYNHTVDTLWNAFEATTPKEHWGMIWCA